MANRRLLSCVPILLFGLGASVLHAKDYKSPLTVENAVVVLNPNDRLLSPNGQYCLTLSDEGHASIKDVRAGVDVWRSSNVPDSNDRFILELQSNGNIVIYSMLRKRKAGVWSTNAFTQQASGAVFAMQDDGILKVLRRNAGASPIWESPSPKVQEPVYEWVPM
jgi:hypothetical protein